MTVQRILTITAVLLFTLSASAADGYIIAPSDDGLFQLEVYKTGLMRGKSHIFHFTRYRGELHYDEAAPENSTVRFIVEAASAECKDDWVKPKQLTDIEKYAFEDMMAVKEHPEFDFESDSVTAAADGAYTVVGQLSIRGQAKPSTIIVKLEPQGDSLVLTGTAVVDLKDYGIKPKKAALGTIGTKSEMDITFTLTANR